MTDNDINAILSLSEPVLEAIDELIYNYDCKQRNCSSCVFGVKGLCSHIYIRAKL